MPFIIQEVRFFVCPVCKTEHPLREAPSQGEVIQCQDESCNGQEAFADFIRNQKISQDPSLPASVQTPLPSPASTETAKSTVEIKRKQPLLILIFSAIIISVGLVMTWFLLLYLFPLILGRGMTG